MSKLQLLSDFCKRVGNNLGKGFSENVYQEGIALMLRRNKMEYSKEVVLQIKLDDIVIGNVRADIVLPDEEIVIECKAIDSNLKPSHAPQLINYLEILNYNSGMLVNFNQNPSKEFVEVVIVERESQNYSVKFNEKTYLMTNKGMLIE